MERQRQRHGGDKDTVVLEGKIMCIGRAAVILSFCRRPFNRE